MAQDNGSALDHGVFVVGEYLGVKEPGSWTPPGETKAVGVPPKLGVNVDGREVAVVLASLADLAAIAPGAAKGDTITVPVRVYAQRSGRGVRYVWAGVTAEDGGGRWT